MLAKEIVRDVHHDEKRKGAQNESSFFSSSALLRAQSDPRFRVRFVLLHLVSTTATEGGGGGGGKHHLLKLFSLILCDDELFFGLKKSVSPPKREKKKQHTDRLTERERKEKNIFFRFCLLHALNKLTFTIFFFFRIYYTLKAHTDSNYIYINKTQKKDDFEREICEEQQREEEF